MCKWVLVRDNEIQTFLVVQCLRLNLPMQGTQVQPLVQEDPICRQGASKPKHHNYWSLCAYSPCSATREVTAMKSLFSSVQSLSRIWLFVTSWTATCQASLSINSQSLLKLTTIDSVMPSNHLIHCPPSPPTFNLSQYQGLFQWVSSSHQVAKVLELQLQHQSFQWIFRTDFL